MRASSSYEQQATQSKNQECSESLMCRTTEMIQENPGLSMLVVFGVGLGVGALLSEAIVQTTAAMQPSESTFERLGRQLCETLHIPV